MSAISGSGLWKPNLRWLMSRMRLLRPSSRPFGDFSHLRPMIQSMSAELTQAGVAERPGLVLADAGYWNRAGAIPSSKPNHTTRPYTGSVQGWRRISRGSAPKAAPPPGPKAPLGGLDHPATLLVRRPPPKHADSARPLLTDGLRRDLLDQPELGGDHPHSRHRHRAHRTAGSAAEHVQ